MFIKSFTKFDDIFSSNLFVPKNKQHYFCFFTRKSHSLNIHEIHFLKQSEPKCLITRDCVILGKTPTYLKEIYVLLLETCVILGKTPTYL